MTELIRAPQKQNLSPPPDMRAVLGTLEGVTAAIDGLQRWAEQVSRVVNNLVTNVPADSTASTVAEVVTDLNALQDAIRDLQAQ